MTNDQNGIAQPLSADEIERLQRELVDALSLPEFGGHAGNISLIQRLGWPQDRYWMIRDRLVDAGKLVIGRGRGGSVRLPQSDTPVSAAIDENVMPSGVEAAQVSGPEYEKEEDLYTPILNSLRGGYWKKNKRLDEFECEVTARQGRRQRFACARLSRPCLPKSCPGVSATLTTTAFARSSLRWLEIGS
jgi:hypothetical protein